MKTETWELLEVVEDDDTDKNENKNENVYKEPTVPPPRWMHTSSTVEAKAGTEMYVFGGCSSSFAPIDDLWKFSGKDFIKKIYEVYLYIKYIYTINLPYLPLI